ncbi:MAG: hypothetical protein HZC36_13795 [Armatimonadetes bacterium]|nr:hypothetical protein [Armatimonadota bacterium]
MVRFTLRNSTCLTACLALALAAAPIMAQRVAVAKSASRLAGGKGVAVAYPWVFSHGTKTAKASVQATADGILQKANYTTVSASKAAEAWKSKKLATPRFGRQPTAASLRTFGRSLKASKVIYGSVSWHTRSIWVNLGPKTISTATVNVYVFDVASGKVVFKKTGVKGRSDEKSNGYKIAGAVLLTPLVTAVSGGPATPQEQRAMQIALGNAYHNWALPSASTN